MKFRFAAFLLLQLALFSLSASGAVIFTPVLVAKNVYAFIGDTNMRTYENEGDECQ